MSKSSSVGRVGTIVSRLNQGKKLSISELAYEFDVSDRTIRRDMALIQEVFGDFLVSDKGLFYAVKRDLLADVLSPAELSLFKSILTLAEISGLSITALMSKKEKEKLVGKIKESERIYLFKSRPFEEFKARPQLFEQLEKAVKHRWVVTLEYEKEGTVLTFKVKPYAIVFISENFYLASELNFNEQPHVLMSRVAMIQNVTHTGEYFERDRQFSKFVTDFQTPWPNYKPLIDGSYETIEVMLEIAPDASRYFKLKKFLPTQEIIGIVDGGSILVKYTVTSVREIVPLCRQWLPHIKTVYPASLKAFLLEEVQLASENLKS